MQKKKFDLTSDIIDVKLEDKPKETKEQCINTSKKKVLMTFAVDLDTRKEYKTWCARNSLKMNEAFIKGFNLLKKQDHN